jgi:hypothetical protein
MNEDQIKKLKIVRHGKGVQLFSVNELTCSSKYEGQWNMDIKHGYGICTYPDGSVYHGEYLNGHYEGSGKFTWKNGDVYVGKWGDGKMEGEGEFKHNDGHILKGFFKNNYYSEVKS